MSHAMALTNRGKTSVYTHDKEKQTLLLLKSKKRIIIEPCIGTKKKEKEKP